MKFSLQRKAKNKCGVNFLKTNFFKFMNQRSRDGGLLNPSVQVPVLLMQDFLKKEWRFH